MVLYLAASVAAMLITMEGIATTAGSCLLQGDHMWGVSRSLASNILPCFAPAAPCHLCRLPMSATATCSARLHVAGSLANRLRSDDSNCIGRNSHRLAMLAGAGENKMSQQGDISPSLVAAVQGVRVATRRPDDAAAKGSRSQDKDGDQQRSGTFPMLSNFRTVESLLDATMPLLREKIQRIRDGELPKPLNSVHHVKMEWRWNDF